MPSVTPAVRADLLSVRNVSMRFGGIVALDNVSFDMAAGHIVGLIGPNGAGKTTTFRMTVGLIAPDAGTVLFNGRDIARVPMYRRARLGIGYLAQESSAFKFLTAEDNILAILETRSDLDRAGRNEEHRDGQPAA